MRFYLDSDLASRLWWRVLVLEDKDKCWIWTGATTGKGYGQIVIKYKKYKAHRIAWEVTYGPVPEGLKVLHTCDNPPCCNPKHLFVGTQKDNMIDASNKGHLLGRRR